MKHLHESVLDYLALKESERIQKIKADVWIGYSRAKDILDKLDELYNHPKTLRMPNLLLMGETNNGKTVLVNRFFNKHLPFIRDEDNVFIAPVVYVQAPPKPDEKRFYSSILDALAIPFRHNDRVGKQQFQVIQVLKHMETKILIIDEIHHILAGTMTNQRVFLNVIKYLSNELKMAIVAVGTKEAYNAINADPQLGNRFEPAPLPRWKLNEEYLRLLLSFEQKIPLKKASNLIQQEIATTILTMGEGKIGEISTILKKAAVLAITSEKEMIDMAILKHIDYISPSARKRQVDKIDF
ncbi:TniB family NTP-binding protein [Mucilaginibacter sp. SG564]|uniref:TniB family NTP-binding protein n=1 Tax=Mucilaginibacter sp. SG564 TaxID=2587022 RepID=UPI001552EC24|nr:TniB family NTP-binding protein [Mucilaginibacter sp. SG564]NOW94767.1 type II secretory pathway predicted ATPase ExeA [Mucilaginibacter sp. SG564]